MYPNIRLIPSNRTRLLATVTACAVLLSGCATDVVMNPAVAVFEPKADAAIEQASNGYDAAVSDINEVTVSYLTVNTNCLLNDRVIFKPANPERSLGCLTDAEKLNPIYTGLPTTRLDVLSRAEFQQQFALIAAVAKYTKVLAENTETPSLDAKAEIQGIAKNLDTVRGGVDAVLAAAHAKDASDSLAAAGGKISQFLGSTANLVGQLELISKNASSAKALKKALLDSGPGINVILKALADDADDWSCIRLAAQSAAREQRKAELEPQLAKMDPDTRRGVVREFVGYWAARSDKTCGAADRSSAFKSPIGKMLRETAKANVKLIEIGKGNYTPAQRRAIVAATIDRLAGALKGIASLAVLFI